MDTNRLKFMNVNIDSLTAEEAVHVIDTFVRERKPRYVVTPNSDIVVKMQKDEELLDACNNADLILTDGQIVVKLASYLGKHIKERVPMTDFIWNVLDLANENGYRVCFFGGREEVLKKGTDRIRSKYPNLKIADVYSPKFGFEKDEKELAIVIDRVKKCDSDILLVFLGCPKQEKFLAKYRNEIGIPVSITMGGCIDFIGNDNIKRAPLWMQKAGMEWFFRFIMEPKRLFKRYFIDDIAIFPLVMKAKLGTKK